MNPSKAISASKAPEAVGPYSHANWAGDLLYLSGQLGIDPASKKLVDGGVAEQARQSMKNLSAVLEEAGMMLANLVKVNIFLVDMEDFAAVNQVYASFFPEGSSYPARACVAVKALPLGGQVEIEGVAHK